MKVNQELLATPGPGQYYDAYRDSTFKKAMKIKDPRLDIPPSVKLVALPKRPMPYEDLGPGTYEPFRSVFDVRVDLYSLEV